MDAGSANPVPLAPEDLKILALESDTVAGHTCKVVLVGPGAPGIDELRASIGRRLGSAPPLTRRLGGSADAPAWVPDPDFDLAEHVLEQTEAAPLDAEQLRAAVARLFTGRLDRTRPLWRMDVLPLAGGGRALVWRIHHALADGTAAMRFGSAVLWDAVSAAAAPPAPHRRAEDARRHAHLAAFLRHELALSSRRSPFDARIGAHREVAFASVGLASLHDAAKRLAGATVNDAVLTCIGGALRRWIQHHHGHLGSVRVKVPVSLHHPGDDAGNRDSSFTVALPLHEEDPVTRLRAVHAATAVRKADHDAETLDELMRDLARVSPRLERFCARVEKSPRAFALNVSNVPGPRGRVSVLGAPVESVHSLAEIGERHALRVAVVSLGGRLEFGFCSDPSVFSGLQVLADGVEADARALAGAAA